MPENPTVVFPTATEVTIEDRPVPELSAEEVVIRTKRTLISTGTELTALSGDYPEGSFWDEVVEYPDTPGYCNVGVVDSVGDDVDSLAVGDRVATTGNHAAFVTANASDCLPIPDGVSDEEAVFFTIAAIAMNGVRRSRLEWGESAVVYGLGLVGQLAARIVTVAGARQVIGVDLEPDRIERLADNPIVTGVDPTNTAPAEIVDELTDGRGADVVFEVTGNSNVIPQELSALREQGRLIILSSPRGETAFDFHDNCNAPSYEIIGAHSNSHPEIATPSNPWTKHRHTELFFEYLAHGHLDVSRLISHRRRYDAAPETYEMLLEDRSSAMGVVLNWD